MSETKSYFDYLTSGIDEARKAGESKVFFNDSIADCADVIAVMMGNSSRISMYCGEGLLFKSEKLKSALEAAFKESGLNEADAQRETDERLVRLENGVREFLDRGGKLDVVVQTPNSNFWSELNPAYKKHFRGGNVSVSQLSLHDPSSFEGLHHMSFGVERGDETRWLYRHELDHDSHSALVAYEKPDDWSRNRTEGSFAILKSFSAPIPIN